MSTIAPTYPFGVTSRVFQTHGGLRIERHGKARFCAANTSRSLRFRIHEGGILGQDISCILLFSFRMRKSSHPIGRHNTHFLDMQPNLAFDLLDAVDDSSCPYRRPNWTALWLYAPLGPLLASDILVLYLYITPASCAQALTLPRDMIILQLVGVETKN